MVDQQLIGKFLGRYKLIAPLGEGGMGKVFFGHDPTLGRVIAIKVMHLNQAQDLELQARFWQGARAAARLSHSGIVPILDAGQEDSLPYIVMAFIPGGSLQQKLQTISTPRQGLPLAEALYLVRQVCLALDYAHREGVLHRDIKPDNILLKKADIEAPWPYCPMLTDFGLAKLREGGLKTQEGHFWGTPAYMAPEQLMGQSIDARSDIYTMGVLLYRLTMGQLPFPVKSLADAVRCHITERPPDPWDFNPAIPEQVVDLLGRALAKDPRDRFQSAAEMAEALSTAMPVSDAPLDPVAIPISLMDDTLCFENSLESSL